MFYQLPTPIPMPIILDDGDGVREPLSEATKSMLMNATSAWIIVAVVLFFLVAYAIRRKWIDDDYDTFVIAVLCAFWPITIPGIILKKIYDRIAGF